MGRRTLLKPAEIAEALKALKGWKREGKELVRRFEFDAYADGLDFALRLGRKADEANHHPDLVIGYCKVTVRWTTHDSGGITPMDLAGAKMTESVKSGA